MIEQSWILSEMGATPTFSQTSTVTAPQFLPINHSSREVTSVINGGKFSTQVDLPHFCIDGTR